MFWLLILIVRLRIIVYTFGAQISIILIPLNIWQGFYRLAQKGAGVDHAFLEKVQLIPVIMAN